MLTFEIELAGMNLENSHTNFLFFILEIDFLNQL